MLKTIIPILNRFPKNQKFTLADRIQDQVSDLLEIYIKAYYIAPKQKLALLKEANIQLETLRHYLRLCYELGILKPALYKDLSLRLNEIGRMTGGWIKHLKS